ncbi:hypothetical protein SLS64_008953 [Diaporthe eres]|uniref:NADH dehydrogenase [ubiquinone] 1 beta subcomplex subunit 11, mitochondrial n=2 Tax=Diaporthe eres species complex TaxID=2972384 RepID=A0ABR1NSQ6_DIAER|nr:NADH:ubiquinone oxidoreductase 11.6 [Diaporthe eres]
MRGAAVRQAVLATRASRQTATAASRRTFATTPARRGGGHGHGPEYDPPTGWLFGVRPGEKAEKEGWEGLAYYGFCGSLVAFGIAYAFKPDTSIQTWALEEARRRLEAEGILEDPAKKN